ncbi:MAG: ClpXP protease specificity-enhancing factor SspB [Holosporaceae bacterium]|jgi:hypothetical protein|nr:ClpXP protease specificity-enhancing factor SspB [Holosporaceae bacterium]
MNSFKYDELVQKALISVVKKVLEEVALNGLSGEHHFYIRFRTDHPATQIPAFLKERHPEEIMIVIQYQFWNLKVFPDKFCVDLSFNGVQENLSIPFSALTAFVDPSVKFALQFTPSFIVDPTPDEPKKEPVENKFDKNEKIISFDSFHKK